MNSEYFLDLETNDEWNGDTNYNLYNAQSAVGKAGVATHAQGLTVYVDTNGTCTAYALYCMVGKVILSIGSYSKTLYSVWDSCTGGCNNPFCQGNPTPITYQLTQDEVNLAVQNGSVQLSISACGNTTYDGVMGLKPVATLTQEIPQQYSTGSVTIMVVLPDGTDASGASVTLNDTTSGESAGTEKTDSNGVVVFNDLTVGDTFEATIEYGTLQETTDTFSLESQSESVTVNMKCAAGYIFKNGSCVTAPPTGLAGEVLTGLEYVGIIAGVVGAVVIIAKVIPERKETIIKAAQTAGQRVRQTAQKIKQKITPSSQ